MKIFDDKMGKELQQILKWLLIIIIICWIVDGLDSTTKKEVSNTQNVNNSITNEASDATKAIKVEQSKYNDIPPSEYFKEMKSDNLDFSDIAWQAQNTYGWNCSEITSLGEKVSTNGNEIEDSLLRSQMVGYYQVATCSSDTKLRVYPRKDTYPIITNINGGWE